MRPAGKPAANIDANNLSMRLQGRTLTMLKTPFSDRIRRISEGVCLGGSPMTELNADERRNVAREFNSW
jgi:hypothetical protein